MSQATAVTYPGTSQSPRVTYPAAVSIDGETLLSPMRLADWTEVDPFNNITSVTTDADYLNTVNMALNGTRSQLDTAGRLWLDIPAPWQDPDGTWSQYEVEFLITDITLPIEWGICAGLYDKDQVLGAVSGLYRTSAGGYRHAAMNSSTNNLGTVTVVVGEDWIRVFATLSGKADDASVDCVWKAFSDLGDTTGNAEGVGIAEEYQLGFATGSTKLCIAFPRVDATGPATDVIRCKVYTGVHKTKRPA